MDQFTEQSIMRKLFLRLVPLLTILYIISYIDRVNVSFAALTMNKQIGLSPYIYGWGAGIFFIGYCAFEIPSNLMLVRFGARRWIARILFTWGLCAVAMCWVQGPKSFLTMRFILGVAEAGFFPGVILYLTYWFPARYRARIISRFMLSIPISLAVGAPVSTWILQLEGTLGFHGWQWLYFIEGIPAVLLTLAVLKLLPDDPSKAAFLSDGEKLWLKKELERDHEQVVASKSTATASVARVFTSPIILALGFIYFAATGANLGLSMFLPQIIKSQGFSTMQTGFITSIPYITGCIGMLTVGYLSDRFKERKWHLIVCLLLITIGLGTAGYFSRSIIAIFAISIATVGIMGAKGPFWPIPSAYLKTGTGAAAGIAFINSLGNLGGFAGPYVVGWAKQVTNSFSGGLYALATITLLGAFVTLVSIRVKKNGMTDAAEKISSEKVAAV
jgi:ACS family tartrate transporter-like MFS transporter